MTDRVIALQADEALVLFELLHRWEEDEPNLGLKPGEQSALWALSCLLERVVMESFDPRYTELVERARQQLVERGGA